MRRAAGTGLKFKRSLRTILRIAVQRGDGDPGKRANRRFDLNRTTEAGSFARRLRCSIVTDPCGYAPLGLLSHAQRLSPGARNAPLTPRSQTRMWGGEKSEGASSPRPCPPGRGGE